MDVVDAGVQLDAAVRALACERRDGWSASALSGRVLDVIGGWRGVERQLVRALVPWDAQKAWALDSSLTPSRWLAHHGDMSTTAARRLMRCVRVARRHRRVADALDAGLLDVEQLDRLASLSFGKREELFERDLDVLLQAARTLSPDGFARAARLWRALSDDALADDEFMDRFANRGLYISELGDGRVRLDAEFDEDGGSIVMAAILAKAGKPDAADRPGGPRSAAQRRTDALVEICREWMAGENHRRGGPVHTVEVAVDFETLLECIPDDLLDDLFPADHTDGESEDVDPAWDDLVEPFAASSGDSAATSPTNGRPGESAEEASTGVKADRPGGVAEEDSAGITNDRPDEEASTGVEGDGCREAANDDRRVRSTDDDDERGEPAAGDDDERPEPAAIDDARGGAADDDDVIDLTDADLPSDDSRATTEPDRDRHAEPAEGRGPCLPPAQPTGRRRPAVTGGGRPAQSRDGIGVEDVLRVLRRTGVIDLRSPLRPDAARERSEARPRPDGRPRRPLTLEDLLHRRCEIRPGVPIGRNTLVRLMCDSYIGRVILRGRSEAIDVGRRTRTFTGPQRRGIAIRDGAVCSTPGCTEPADNCDCHHEDPFGPPDTGTGRTDIAKGSFKCRYCHVDEHEGQHRNPR